MHKIKQMIKYIATLLLTVLFVACNNGKGQQPSEENEDPKAKEILQGIWLDDETETPLMRIIGDTIYYSDAQSAPVYFKILKDTLYTYGKGCRQYYEDCYIEVNILFGSILWLIILSSSISRKILMIHWHSPLSRSKLFRPIQKSLRRTVW